VSPAAPPLPTFLLIGAQKAGTTTLHRLLQQHPQAFLCDPKEPNFFSSPRQWGRGTDWYRSLFAAAGNARALGEASTTYSMYPHYAGVVDRALSVLAEPAVIYLTREPLARMRSAYRHALAWGSERRPIAAALTQDPRYLLASSYALQIEQWLTRIPRERVLLLSLEQFAADPAEVLPTIARFLGIDPDWHPAGPLAPENVGTGKSAPRGWWRRLGTMALRRGIPDEAPPWLVRLSETSSPLVRRQIPPADLAIPAETARQLRHALADDQARLRRIWSGTLPDWLDDHPSTRAKSGSQLEG
jgi:hypothetical protein